MLGEMSDARFELAVLGFKLLFFGLCCLMAYCAFAPWRPNE